MANYLVTDTQLTSVADAIRAKTGASGGLSFPDGMVNAVGDIQTGGGEDALEMLLNKTLTSYANSNVTSIYAYTFQNCSALTTVSFPSATSIGNYAFTYCSALTTADFPAATTIGGSAFRDCYALTTVSFPAATQIGSSAFRGCYALTTVSFPVATSIGAHVFYGCSALTTADFPAVTSIGANAFYDCSALTSLILASTSMASCGISIFNNASNAIAYVNDALVSDYKAATNWSQYASRIKGISELPSE